MLVFTGWRRPGWKGQGGGALGRSGQRGQQGDGAHVGMKEQSVQFYSHQAMLSHLPLELYNYQGR